MAWPERVDLPGGRLMRRLVDLPFVRSHNAMMGLSWRLVHMLEEGNAFLRALSDQQFSLTVSVTGMNTILYTQSIADGLTVASRSCKITNS
jgi:inward rectifier potassium channel